MITARVIAPSRSLGALRDWHGFDDAAIARATGRLETNGIRVEFGAHVDASGPDGVAPIEARLADLHDAYEDKAVDCVLALSGGTGAIQLLDQIDYERVARCPKPLFGYSDVGYLHLALLARLGRIGYYGPNFASFADDAEHSLEVSDFADLWTIVDGDAEGEAVGGSALTVQMLKGTPYLPALEGAVVFLETAGHGKATLMGIDSDLRALALLPDRIAGLVIGRHERLPRAELERIVGGIPRWRAVPVVGNAPFGHCSPRGTLPLGARCRVAGPTVSFDDALKP